MTEQEFFPKATQKLRHLLGEHQTLEEALREMRKEGFRAAEVMHAISAVKQIPLQEADSILLSSEAWSDIRASTEQVRRAFLDALEECPGEDEP